ncbi:MAG: carbohydrate-binding family 9-like protein [Dysgonomonas sp.]|nr:carbohydrate-binding family 9-like protein [Dysgonomonas sp.]
MLKNIWILLFLFSLISIPLSSQSPFQKYSNLFTPPLSYVVPYTDIAPEIDGDINEDAWQKATWTGYFQDIEGDLKPKPYYQTRAKMLWDDNYLYIAAELKDPHVWGTLTKRDQIIFYDNDFEVFLDPYNTTHSYFEIEINALNNIFDLFLTKPYRNGGVPLFSWDTAGMLHAVKVHGTLNNPHDIDEGWTIEMAIPYRALSLSNHINVPEDKEIWRINFSRVQWDTDIEDGQYVKRRDADGDVLPENNWVWSPQGIVDMHRPERWGYLQFSKSGKDVFVLPYSEKQKQYLWLAYYMQKDFLRKNNRYATTLNELGLDKLNITIDSKINKLSIASTNSRFDIKIKDEDDKWESINEDGLILK